MEGRNPTVNMTKTQNKYHYAEERPSSCNLCEPPYGMGGSLHRANDPTHRDRMCRRWGVGSYRGGQSLGSEAYTKTASDDPNSDFDSYADAHSDPDGYSYGYVYADTFGDCYANGNADSNSYRDTNSYGYIHANPDGYSCGYAHTNSHADADTNTDSHGDANSSCWSGSGLQFQRRKRDDGNRCLRPWYYWQHHRSDLDHRRQIWQCVEFQWIERLCGPG